MTIMDFPNRCETFLTKQGFIIAKSVPDAVGAPNALHATCRHGSNRFLGSTDYLFIHFGDTIRLTADRLLAYHASARRYVNGLFRVPRLLRWHVPYIITIGFNVEGFDDTTVAAVRDFDNLVPSGGERHAIYLADGSGTVTAQGNVPMQGRHGRGVAALAIPLREFNPQERGYRLASALATLANHDTDTLA